MLRLEHLVTGDGDFRLSAHWDVAAGETLALLGASGAGKSTLLSAIAGFAPVHQGRLLWQDRPFQDRTPSDRPVSMVFQDHNLFGHLDVTQNIALGRNPSLRLTPDDKTRISAVLAEVGLDGLGTRRPSELSGGQQSRVALARALVRQKGLWLLDEPFAALGPGLRRDMLDLVKRVAQGAGATVILVTHDPQDALRFARQTSFIADGVAQAPVPTGQLFEAPPDPLKTYLGTQ